MPSFTRSRFGLVFDTKDRMRVRIRGGTGKIVSARSGRIATLTEDLLEIPTQFRLGVELVERTDPRQHSVAEFNIGSAKIADNVPNEVRVESNHACLSADRLTRPLTVSADPGRCKVAASVLS